MKTFIKITFLYFCFVKLTEAKLDIQVLDFLRSHMNYENNNTPIFGENTTLSPTKNYKRKMKREVETNLSDELNLVQPKLFDFSLYSNEDEVYEGKDFPGISLTDILASLWTIFLNFRQNKEDEISYREEESELVNEAEQQCVTNRRSKSDDENLCDDGKTSHSRSEEPEEEFQLVEPMVFDLITEMGSNVGQMEIAYLMIIPLNGDSIEILPEYEVVYSEHQAGELQLGFENKELEAYKFGHQTTFRNEPFFKDGFQVLGDFLPGNPEHHKSPSIEVVALYLNAQRLAPMISDLLMVGLRFEGRINGHNQLSEIEIAGLVLNNSVFVEMHKNTKIGIEMLYYYNLHDDDESFIVFYPQIHLQISEIFKLQFGIGLFFRRDKFVAQLVHKPILMTPKEVESEKP